MSDHPDTTVTHQPAPADPARAPRAIGRYRVERPLGRGGFGTVYLARDDRLQRLVAVKVPHAWQLRPEDADAYLAEARTVAALDHPNVVPVYDVDGTPDCPCYIVSKFIDGGPLTDRVRAGPLPPAEAAALVAAVADALHYAHRKGLVHRDVKPGNILLDSAGRPHVADFGLALRDQDVGRGPRYAGTPPYMSPEQARGEGHRVDGRSDIFSLGVVLYELLTGQRPFRGETESELLEEITGAEPRPPRQVDDRIPKELERVCLKALAKRAAERYTTARDMADDLRHFLAHAAGEGRPLFLPPGAPDPASDTLVAPDRPDPPGSSREAVRVVPKGLRSFDAHDADFFLALVPGPRDRDGLPDAIRFWKARVEETDPDETFAVGLIYGPSGCGKSSLVKAGLLPRLSDRVTPVYVEATADGTEARLLAGLRRHCPVPDAAPGLTGILTALRRGPGLGPGRKVLLVLDQFEQWLHAHAGEADPELVRALRQCDGRRAQCLILVRDDFWLAVSRFLRALEVDLVPGRNVALVDLFDPDHARKVLAAFGRAYGKLPERPQDLARDQAEFLRQAVAELARDNKVVPVRLALFAEMMKGRPWTPAALKEVGGPGGLGVAFLDETFTSPAANPRHRLHHAAARGVLKALLPEAGGDIKGNMRSEAELRAAAGYADRPAEFADLMRVLDGEVRLITPTDPEGKEEGGRVTDEPAGGPGSSVTLPPSSFRYYQLTHDYLVHSLRDWLTRQQKATRRGRAELRLADRAAIWAARPERRLLPSVSEWARIRLFTRPRDWTPPQRQLMRAADRHYAVRALAVAAVLAVAAWGAGEYTAGLRAEGLKDQLLRADVTEVSAVLDDIQPHAHRVEPLLREAYATETDPKRRLNLSLALARWGPGPVDDLTERLLTAEPREFGVIRDGLALHRAAVVDRLRAEFANREGSAGRRLRAASALVSYAPDDPSADDWVSYLVGNLATNPVEMTNWKDAFRPAGWRLLPALAAALEGPRWDDQHRRALVAFYRDFAADRADGLRPLADRLGAERPLAAATPDEARRTATVLAALAALGRPDEAWPALVRTSDPTLRSYLIERLATSGLDPAELRRRFDREPDVSARRALLLALGGMPPEGATDYAPWLVQLYENDPDPGIHGAAGWVLRRPWGRGHLLDPADARLATGAFEGARQWYVSKGGPTLGAVTGPGALRDRGSGPAPPEHRFAVAATEVTIAQFRAFRPDYRPKEKGTPDPRRPANYVSWHDAAGFCEWLGDRDGIPKDQRCYERTKDGKWELVPGYQDRSGYRLPTEREWEYACRAGAVTPWHFGQADDELVGCYERWLGNSSAGGTHRSFPVASLKPNDWGLFDMHGNLSEWCQESVTPGTAKISDVQTALRGGAFRYPYQAISATAREVSGRTFSFPFVTFRVVRTLP